MKSVRTLFLASLLAFAAPASWAQAPTSAAVEVAGVRFDTSTAIDYTPGVGTVVSINGKAATDPITEPVFFTALMKIWLGASPADWQLKDALLGQSKG